MKRTLLSAAAFAAMTVTATGAQAQDARYDELQRQVDAIQAQMQQLRNQLPAGATTVDLNNGAPRFRTGDGNFEFQFTGRMHLDFAKYFEDEAGRGVGIATRDLNDGFNFRRLRLGVTGRFAKNFGFSFIGEFGGSDPEGVTTDEATLSYTGIPNTTITLGAFKPPSSLEDNTSSNDITFIERASAVNVATSYAAGTARMGIAARHNGPNYFVGAALTGTTLGNGGSGVTGDLEDEQFGATARVAFTPINRAPTADVPNTQLIHLGANFETVFEPSQDATVTAGAVTAGLQLRDRPELRVDGQRLVDTGVIQSDGGSVYGLELAGIYNNVSLQGEYFFYEVDQQRRPGAAAAQRTPDLSFEGFYLMGSWVVTGEHRRYDIRQARMQAPRPAEPFTTGGMGAIELAARYSYLDLNDGEPADTVALGTTGGVRGGEQEIYTFGVNWYLSNNLRVMFNYLIVDVERIAAGGLGVNRAGDLGVEYDALAVRTQWNF